jgi:hypothetical protein
MSESVENFLSSQLPVGGLAAYSIHVHDSVLATQCLTKSLYPTSTEQILHRVVKSGRALLPAGEQAAHYCWTFEAHKVYVASRPDGGCLALLVENNPNAQLTRVKEILQGFLDLPEI